MNISRWNPKRVLLTFVLFVAAAGSQAGSIELTPVRINISDVAKVAVLTVRNTGTEESVMQVTLNKWIIDGQNYVYKQSQDLIVTPVTFRLAPGAKQIVRVGLSGAPPANKEAAYRLLVEEVPPLFSPNDTQTRLVIRHDLPVFVAPVAVVKPALDVSLECAVDGASLRVTNIGNVHTQFRSIVLESVTERNELARWDTFDYLLPEAHKNWKLAQIAPAAVGKSFLVTAFTDHGSFTVDVKNTCS